MLFERLSNENIDEYIDYFKIAMSEEPDLMVADKVDEDAIKKSLPTRFSAEQHLFSLRLTIRLLDV